jgi:hypothetical protein
VRTGRIICVTPIDRYAARPGYIDSDDGCYREVGACESKVGLLTCDVNGSAFVTTYRADRRSLRARMRTAVPVEYARLQPVIW